MTHYTANPGDIGLRQAIAGFEAEKRGLTYTPEEVLVTLGATQAIYTAMTGVLNPGDEVIIPTPAFSLYDTVARMAGATPVYVDTAGDGFQLTAQAVERAVTEKTKLLVLNSPNNPTGVVYTRENLGALANLVRERDMFVLCDDVYWGLGPCFTFTQFTQLKEKILAVQSFSKPYAMTGWRIGYLMAPQPVLERLTVLHSHMVTCAPTMLQAACKAALAGTLGDGGLLRPAPGLYLPEIGGHGPAGPGTKGRLLCLSLRPPFDPGRWGVVPPADSPGQGGCGARFRVRRPGVPAHVLLLCHGPAGSGHGPAGGIFAESVGLPAA